MVILGIDCSSKQSSVCITENGKPIYTAVQATDITHSQNLLPMVDSAFSICSIKKEDIDLFAVTVGPGSFTGLRIGLALVKGMATAMDKPCVGVSSLKALTASVNLDGVVIPAIDARRGQIYCNITENSSVIKEEACIMANSLQEFIANCKKNIFFIGDGSNLCYNMYGNFSNVKKYFAPMPCIAYGACILAQNMPSVSHFQLTPSYLRLSQAEQELKEKQK